MRDSSSYQVMLKVMKVSHMLVVAGSEYLKKYQLTLIQFNVLMILKHEENNGCNQKTLCDRLSVKGPNLTTLIKRMLLLKVIDRKVNPNDDREKLIYLSKKGLSLIKKIEPDYFKEVENIFGDISKTNAIKMIHNLETVERKIIKKKFNG